MRKITREILGGAGYGILVSLSYAIVEFALLTLVPLFTQADLEVDRPFWRANGLLLVGYIGCGAFLGAVTGGLFGLLATGARTSKHRLMAATLWLPIVFSANLLTHWPLSGGGKISLAVSIALLVALIDGLVSSDGRGRMPFLTGPLTASMLLLLPPWINQEQLEGRSNLVQLAAISATLLGVVVLSFLLGKVASTRRPPTSYRYAVGVIALLAVSCAAALALNPRSPNLSRRASLSSGRRPNVVMIVLDTVRADHTSLYGYARDTTPYLRQLAKQATLYKRVQAVSDYTLPTHASIFTGLYPRTHGAYFAPPNYPKGRPLAEHFTTMAEVLHSNGYRTAGIVANPGFLSPEMGFEQGFDLYDWRAPVLMTPYAQTQYLRRDLRLLLDRFAYTDDFEARTRGADEINEEANRFLNQVDAPFFLFLNYMDAHGPWDAPSPYNHEYACSEPNIQRFETTGALRQQILSGKRAIKPEERDCLMSGYDGGIAFIDSQIRDLVNSLQTRGLYDNTLLVIVGDHGEAFGGRQQLGHAGVSVYQNEVGVPLLIKYPGVKVGNEEAGDASQIDLLPTILDVASIPEPAGLQGISLLKLDSGHPRGVVSMSYRNPALAAINKQFDDVEEAIVFGDKKLVESTSGKLELFDLSVDTDEQHNLYQANSPVAHELSDMLQDWFKNTPPAAAVDTGSTDRSTVERLKSLGYAQ